MSDTPCQWALAFPSALFSLCFEPHGVRRRTKRYDYMVHTLHTHERVQWLGRGARAGRREVSCTGSSVNPSLHFAPVFFPVARLCLPLLRRVEGGVDTAGQALHDRAGRTPTAAEERTAGPCHNGGVLPWIAWVCDLPLLVSPGCGLTSSTTAARHPGRRSPAAASPQRQYAWLRAVLPAVFLLLLKKKRPVLVSCGGKVLLPFTSCLLLLTALPLAAFSPCYRGSAGAMRAARHCRPWPAARVSAPVFLSVCGGVWWWRVTVRIIRQNG